MKWISTKGKYQRKHRPLRNWIPILILLAVSSVGALAAVRVILRDQNRQEEYDLISESVHAEESSTAGTPFMDAKCEIDSDNYIIYGHNMKNGTMFREILQYANKSYWQEHPMIRFDTLYEQGEYEVLSAFYDRVYYADENCFKFYRFIKAADKADYDNAIQNYKEKSLYDTGVTAEYGDKLITLVTCSYHEEHGRFVVVARQMNNNLNNARLLPFTVIQKAAGGDVEAINTVLKHYAGYIAKLSLRELYDEYGNPHLCVDEELRRRLETKLITKILTFRVD